MIRGHDQRHDLDGSPQRAAARPPPPRGRHDDVIAGHKAASLAQAAYEDARLMRAGYLAHFLYDRNRRGLDSLDAPQTRREIRLSLAVDGP